MEVHVETIVPQHDSVRKELKIMILQLDKDLCGIAFRLVPILSHKADENMEARLKHIAIKHSQTPSNIKTHKIKSINNIENPASPRSEPTLRKLVMGTKAENDERFAIVITRTWRGVLELWVKEKYKKHKCCSQSLTSMDVKGVP